MKTAICRYGYTWWINEDQTSVSVERHYVQGDPHGIEREWNEHGRLRRGFPRYFVKGNRIDKRQYLIAAVADPSLPRFRSEENSPERVFPEDICKHLLTQRAGA